MDSRQRQSFTWDFSAKHNHCYCFLSYWGNNFGKRVMDGFWDFVAKGNHDPNPYRAGFLQLVAVSETDAQAEKDYYKHIRYFYDKCLHILPEYFPVAGNQDYKSLVNSVTKLNPQLFDLMNKIPTWKYKDFVDNQFVIAGSPATVRQQLMEAVKKLRVGNLMVLLHIGSMPHELTIKNIDLFCSEVLPHFRGVWDGEWENKWWPESLKGPRKQMTSNGVHAAAALARVARPQPGRTDMAAAKEKTVSVWGDKVHPKVRILGDGPPVVYLHGGYGPIETELLDGLAQELHRLCPRASRHHGGRRGRLQGARRHVGSRSLLLRPVR